MADAVARKLQAGLLDLGQSFQNLAAARQNIVVRALIQRAAGLVPSDEGVSDFAAARVNLLTAGQSSDAVLGQLQSSDPDAWRELIKAFNDGIAKYGVTGIGSSSVAELLDVALPPIPMALFSVKSTPESTTAEALEQAYYPMTGASSGVAGLGFFPALLLPLSEACGTAIVAAGAATAGAGAFVVAGGCVIAGVAIAAGAIYLAGKGLDALVDLFSKDVAISKAETERLKQVTANTIALDKLTEGLTPDQKTAVITQYGAQGVKQPTSDGFPWGLALAAAAGIGLWFYWPKLKASRTAQPAMAGLRRRRRSR